MVRPGSRNLITDVRGIAVGNAEDATAMSGLTVIFAEGRAVGAGTCGGAPGTGNRMPAPEGLNVADAIVLSGGSVLARRGGRGDELVAADGLPSARWWR
jgi:L-aminopeptidase/D-esterase-like protein